MEEENQKAREWIEYGEIERHFDIENPSPWGKLHPFSSLIGNGANIKN